VVVTGRVQGVFFRDGCRDEARAHGVRGFVRNRSDGAVVAEFEGPAAAVERMVAWCRHGPARARVDAVHTERIATVGEPGFRVR
jgi:acylphosphatase